MKKVLLVIPALLVVAGIALLGWLAMANRNASRNDHWSQAVGTIEKADVQPGGVAVTYHYDFGGLTHRNPRGTLRDRAAREALLARYVAGRQVLVYVNPAKAAESVLELPQRPPQWPLMAGPILIILGIALFIVFARYDKLKPRAKAAVRRKAPPMSRLRPPPPIKRD